MERSDSSGKIQLKSNSGFNDFGKSLRSSIFSCVSNSEENELDFPAAVRTELLRNANTAGARREQ